ncbi:MAG: hypothetical protein AAFV43_07225 [Planctomycetota bacterium]
MDWLDGNVIAPVAAALIGAVTTLVATRMQTRAASKAQRDAAADRPARCTLKVLHAKVVRFQIDEDEAAPLYLADTTRVEGQPTEVAVNDETVYTSVETYDGPTPDHEYHFRSSGVADLMCLAPWRPALRYTDRGAASDPHVVRQVFSGEPSDAYVMITHAYNGLQPGNEDFGVRMPQDVDEARLVVDLSSVPRLLDAMSEPPRGELRCENGATAALSVLEYRRGIYCIEKQQLQKNDVLLLDFTFDWSRL